MVKEQLVLRALYSLLTMFAIVSSWAVHGQLGSSYKFDHITSDKGFPAEGVRSIAQDSKSNLWAITEKGLMRYNGHSGKFYPITGDSTGLLKSKPWGVFIDHTGLIWISYMDTLLSSFDPVRERFEHYIPNAAQPGSFPAALVSSMYEDSKKRLWICTWGGGLCLFERKNSTFKIYTNNPEDSTSISTNIVTCLEEEADGTLLVGSWEGGPWLNYFQLFDPETERFSRFDLTKFQFAAAGNFFDVHAHLRIISSIVRDENNDLWIGTYVGLYFVDRTNWVIHKLQPGPRFKAENPGRLFMDNVVNCLVAPDGKIWASAEVGGIMVVDPRSMTYEVLKHKPGLSHTLAVDFIFDTYIDKSGKVFVATGVGGIDVYDPIQNQFSLITNDELKALRFGIQTPHSILSVKNSVADSLLLVGSGGGLSVYHKELGLIEKIIPLERARTTFSSVRFKELEMYRLPNEIRGIWLFPDVWVIGSSSGIMRYYPKTKELDFDVFYRCGWPKFAQQEDTHGYFNANYYTGERNPEGQWISENWIMRYDYEQDDIFPVKKVSLDFGPFFETAGFHIEDFVRIDSLHYYVQVSRTCFQIFNLADSSFTGYGCYAPMQNFPDSVMRPAVADNEGNIWLTAANGFYKFNARTGKSENYKDQLPLRKNERIQCAVMDKNGILWVGVSQDLIRFNSETGETFRFTKRHGLEVGSHIARNRLREMGDTIYLPVADGLLYFEPEKVRIDTSAIFTELSSIIINKDTLNVQETEQFLANPPELSWNKNFITFEFYSTEIYSAGSKIYHYRLHGFDSTWQTSITQNTAQYSNLGSGNYVFEVYCENSSGMKSPVLQIAFSIGKPFWFTWWFITLMVLAGIGIIFSFIKYRERKMIKVQERLENTVQERTLEVREKMQEIELQKEIIEDKNKEMTDSIKYAKRIQNTLLAHEELLKENLPEHFVLFKPKDIVSGDFYWAAKHGDRFYVAVCDSTGHGVPGAFMSLLNIRFLNEAIVERNVAEPNEILDFVRERLIINLSSEGAKDGMDGTLFYIDQDAKRLVYASAHNTPVLIRNGIAQELKADKMPIGSTERMRPFELQIIDLQQGDSIFFFTDGYADQFGGLKGKKLKQKTMVELMVEIQNLPIQDQQQRLDVFINDWKGDLEQVDDILVIGVRIS